MTKTYKRLQQSQKMLSLSHVTHTFLTHLLKVYFK